MGKNRHKLFFFDSPDKRYCCHPVGHPCFAFDKGRKKISWVALQSNLQCADIQKRGMQKQENYGRLGLLRSTRVPIPELLDSLSRCRRSGSLESNPEANRAGRGRSPHTALVMPSVDLPLCHVATGACGYWCIRYFANWLLVHSLLRRSSTQPGRRSALMVITHWCLLQLLVWYRRYDLSTRTGS